MAAPFSGEDLIKRSILSSILGLKIKTPRFHYQPEACPSSSRTLYPRPVNYDQPCSSKTILNQSEVAVEQEGGCVYPDGHQHEANHYINYEEFQAGDQTLSEQLAEGLFSGIAPSSVLTPTCCLSWTLPQDIYQEIVCECQHFEQQTGPAAHFENPYLYSHDEHNHLAEVPGVALQELQQRHTNYSNSPSTLNSLENNISQRRSIQNICINCHHAIAPKMLHRMEAVVQYGQLAEQQEDTQKIVMPQHVAFEHLKQASVGPVSLEEFIKMVVVAVKEAGGLSKSIRERDETPEEILQRKRLQNNEAAARYRRRQKRLD